MYPSNQIYRKVNLPPTLAGINALPLFSICYTKNKYYNKKKGILYTINQSIFHYMLDLLAAAYKENLHQIFFRRKP